MALPVLDGNQSATTLSSVVTGGEHIVAHSVVSLGATAISNINSAVSGTAVTIPGLARLSNSIASDNTADANLDFIKIGGHQDGQNQVAHIVHVSAGGAMKVDASGSSVTFSQAPVTFGAITGSASILNFPSTQTIAGTVTANVFGYDSYNGTYPQLPVGFASDGFVPNDNVVKALIGTEGGVVNISNPLPISGTVTANVTNSITVGAIVGPAGGSCLKAISPSGDAVRSLLFTKDSAGTYGELSGSGQGIFNLPVYGTITVGNSVTISSLPALPSGNNQIGKVQILPDLNNPIYSVVTNGSAIRIYDSSGQDIFVDGDLQAIQATLVTSVTVGNSVTIGSLPAISGTVTVGNTVAISGTVTANPTGTQTIAGTVTVSAVSTSVTARLVDSTGTAVSYAATGSAGTPSTDVISVQGVSGGTSLPISGTAGTLTTRFGSVTTANTAQISSAVTNTSRKYLLIQNVTTSSNVITIGVGFTPTTTQGIQLTAGAGITFESSYIPTGAVYVLSGVTASPFTILEA